MHRRTEDGRLFLSLSAESPRKHYCQSTVQTLAKQYKVDFYVEPCMIEIMEQMVMMIAMIMVTIIMVRMNEVNAQA